MLQLSQIYVSILCLKDMLKNKTKNNIYSKSGLVGVAHAAPLLCADTVFEMTRSAGTETLRENSVGVVVLFALLFRCLLQ